MTTTPAINTDCLNRLANALENADFRSFQLRTNLDMEYPDRWDHHDPIRSVSDCHATANIAGWTLMIFAPVLICEYQNPDTYLQLVGINRIAQELLELDDDQAADLFFPGSDDLPCDHRDISPRDAANTVRLLADTGRVEWIAEPKPCDYYTKRAPGAWELSIIESSDFRKTGNVFYGLRQTEVSIPKRVPETTEDVEAFIRHIHQTWQRIG